LLLVAGACVAVLVAFSWGYGYHRDELYFIAIGGHPAWGYVDQPPLIPLLAHAMETAFGGSLIVDRLPSALAAGGVALVTGLIARELGGRRSAQLVAAGSMAVAAVTFGSGHLAGTTIFDLLDWTLVSWLVVRALRDGGRSWLLVGLVAGVALEVKTLVVFLLFGLTVGLLVVGPRSVFRSRWPYLAALVAVALWLPNLVWQAANGWPQVEISKSIAAGNSGTSDTPLEFVILQLGLISPLLLPIWVAGLVRLWRQPSLRLWRSFAVAYPLLLAVFLATGGKAYYMAGLYPVLLAAGAPAAIAWATRADRPRRPVWLAAAFGVSALVAAVLFLPVVPASDLHDTPIIDINYDAGEQVGWPEFASTIQAAYDALGPAEQAHAVFLARNYGEGGAVLRYAPSVPTYSVHNSLWDYGPPEADVDTVIATGWDAAQLRQWFGDVRRVGTIENDAGVDNDEDGTPVYLCTGMTTSWSALWPDLRELG
jgi:hypothetical protein